MLKDLSADSPARARIEKLAGRTLSTIEKRDAGLSNRDALISVGLWLIGASLVLFVGSTLTSATLFGEGPLFKKEDWQDLLGLVSNGLTNLLLLLGVVALLCGVAISLWQYSDLQAAFSRWRHRPERRRGRRR